MGKQLGLPFVRESSLTKCMDEVQRIKDVYRKRRGKGKGPYSELFSRQRIDKLNEVIKQEGLSSLKDKIILDVGCGSGSILRYFFKIGATPENLYGIDLIPERIEAAKKTNPVVNYTCGSADRLPYSDRFFDIVTQFTVFTSVLDGSMKKAIASEMLRVLKSEGLIIWHDYRFDNPFNPDVKGIGKSEIMDLFPNCEFGFKLVHLNPLIGRPLAKISLKFCQILERISILRTHWIVTIKRREFP